MDVVLQKRDRFRIFFEIYSETGVEDQLNQANQFKTVECAFFRLRSYLDKLSEQNSELTEIPSF